MWPARAEQRPVLVEAMPSRWDDEPVARSRALVAGLAGSAGVALEMLHWVEAVTAPSPELDEERFHALSPQAAAKLAERLGVAETDLLAELPLGNREIMIRRARIEPRRD